MVADHSTSLPPAPAGPEAEPATYPPTTEEIFSWTDSTPKTANVCPPHYRASSTYAAGDIIEEYSRIYQCQSPPYEAYCNISELDEGWADDQKELWADAWIKVGDCEEAKAEDEAEARDDEVAGGGATIAPIADTESGEAATATEAPIASKTYQLPPCTSDYDTSKSTYIAGELVTVKSHIFRCNEEAGYELYCNIAVWDDGLLTQNENAKKMWTAAWEDLGACTPTQEELMEEEASGT